jgi:hypothetical protein
VKRVGGTSSTAPLSGKRAICEAKQPNIPLPPPPPPPQLPPQFQPTAISPHPPLLLLISVHVLGHPTDADLRWLSENEPEAHASITQLLPSRWPIWPFRDAEKPAGTLKDLLPFAPDDALELLRGMMAPVPVKRFSAATAMNHPFFHALHGGPNEATNALYRAEAARSEALAREVREPPELHEPGFNDLREMAPNLAEDTLRVMTEKELAKWRAFRGGRSGGEGGGGGGGAAATPSC